MDRFNVVAAHPSLVKYDVRASPQAMPKSRSPKPTNRIISMIGSQPYPIELFRHDKPLCPLLLFLQITCGSVQLLKSHCRAPWVCPVFMPAYFDTRREQFASLISLAVGQSIGFASPLLLSHNKSHTPPLTTERLLGAHQLQPRLAQMQCIVNGKAENVSCKQQCTHLVSYLVGLLARVGIWTVVRRSQWL